MFYDPAHAHDFVDRVNEQKVDLIEEYKAAEMALQWRGRLVVEPTKNSAPNGQLSDDEIEAWRQKLMAKRTAPKEPRNPKEWIWESPLKAGARLKEAARLLEIPANLEPPNAETTPPQTAIAPKTTSDPQPLSAPQTVGDPEPGPCAPRP